MENEKPLPIEGCDVVVPATHPAYLKMKEMYGATHTIEAVLGTTPTLRALKSNQTVSYGDGRSFYFRLTENPF